MQKDRNYRFVPLYVSLGVVLGILIGSFYANQYSQNYLSVMNGSGNKLNDLLYIIDDQYVDPVNMSQMVEKALPQILKELDPHSVYIAPNEVEASMQGLNGSFSGVGIQYSILDDSLRVSHVIPGGPSDGSGLQPGDRIVTVDGEVLKVKDLSTEQIAAKLKGPANTQVNLGVCRRGAARPLTIPVVRGNVPVNSISSAYMIDDHTGYIAINTFGDTTFPEFLGALASFSVNDFRQLIIDLRGNLGGYMAPAIQIANEFLPKGRLIVYTEGRKSPRDEYSSDGRGSFQSMPLVILIDESSASASEILAGAIQDNDRGTIVGRRSFGKGLVQVPIEFSDGSMLRITKARYYTPSGRCLQKPYIPGMEEEYETDLIKRWEHGEYYTSDSIHTSGKKYKTHLGRTVYGGGGIIPDVFVPLDTLGMTSYFKEAYMKGLIRDFAAHYVDNHRRDFTKYETVDEVVRAMRNRHLEENFASFAERKGLKRRNLMLKRSAQLFHRFILQAIIDDAYSQSFAIEYANSFDPAVQQALSLLKAGKAFPQKTEE